MLEFDCEHIWFSEAYMKELLSMHIYLQSILDRSRLLKGLIDIGLVPDWVNTFEFYYTLGFIQSHYKKITI